MANISSFNVAYDRDSDVLYISTRREPAARGVEDKFGIVWRYDGAGELIGATIVDLHHYWSGHKAQLAETLSKRFDLPAPQARTLIDHVLEGRRTI
jgi:uncharacterized protein YuzE